MWRLMSFMFTMWLVLNCNPVLADPVSGQNAMDAAGFVQEFSKQLAAYYDQQIDGLMRQRNSLLKRAETANENQRAEIQQQIALIGQEVVSLGEQRRLSAGNETAWRIFNNTKKVIDTLKAMEDALEQQDTWTRQIVWLDRLAGVQIANLQEGIEQANSALEYTAKIQSIMALLQQMDQDAPNIHLRSMIDGMNVLFWGMQEFGDKVPAIGDFIKTYGDVGSAMLKASVRINQKLINRADGMLIDGYPDDGRVRAFDRAFPEYADERDMLDIQHLPGVRDAYVMPNGRVLIWDVKRKHWYDPNLTPDEAMRRYAFMATFGNRNPDIEDIMLDSKQVIGIRLVPEATIIPPSGSTQIHIETQRMDGRSSLELFALSSKQERTIGSVVGLGAGNGSVSPSVVSHGETATFNAPDAANYVFKITAKMAEGHYGYIIGDPSCRIATGLQSKVIARADPPVVEPGGDGGIIFSLQDSEGNPLTAKGTVNVTSFGITTEPIYWLDIKKGRGASSYHAPMQEGQYLVIVSFQGQIDSGFFIGQNSLASQSYVIVKVEKKEETSAVVQPAPTPAPPRPGPARPELKEVKFDPKNLVHIIETSTMYGPIKKDAWILTAAKPDDNGYILTADGSGGNFINKTDKCLGPYTSNLQIRPILEPLGVKYVYLGDNPIQVAP